MPVSALKWEGPDPPNGHSDSTPSQLRRPRRGPGTTQGSLTFGSHVTVLYSAGATSPDHPPGPLPASPRPPGYRSRAALQLPAPALRACAAPCLPLQCCQGTLASSPIPPRQPPGRPQSGWFFQFHLKMPQQAFTARYPSRDPRGSLGPSCPQACRARSLRACEGCPSPQPWSCGLQGQTPPCRRCDWEPPQRPQSFAPAKLTPLPGPLPSRARRGPQPHPLGPPRVTPPEPPEWSSQPPVASATPWRSSWASAAARGRRPWGPQGAPRPAPREAGKRAAEHRGAPRSPKRTFTSRPRSYVNLDAKLFVPRKSGCSRGPWYPSQGYSNQWHPLLRGCAMLDLCTFPPVQGYPAYFHIQHVTPAPKMHSELKN